MLAPVLAFLRSVPIEAYASLLVAMQSIIGAIPLYQDEKTNEWGIALIGVSILFFLLAVVQWVTRHDKVDVLISGLVDTHPTMSFVRVTNSSNRKGEISISLRAPGKNEEGSHVNYTLPAYSTKQLAASEIASAAGMLTISGSNIHVRGDFVGGVEHLVWNPVTGAIINLGGIIKMPKYKR